jgi:hypothetical protein
MNYTLPNLEQETTRTENRVESVVKVLSEFAQALGNGYNGKLLALVFEFIHTSTGKPQENATKYTFNVYRKGRTPGTELFFVEIPEDDSKPILFFNNFPENVGEWASNIYNADDVKGKINEFIITDPWINELKKLYHI